MFVPVVMQIVAVIPSPSQSLYVNLLQEGTEIGTFVWELVLSFSNWTMLWLYCPFCCSGLKPVISE